MWFDGRQHRLKVEEEEVMEEEVRVCKIFNVKSTWWHNVGSGVFAGKDEKRWDRKKETTVLWKNSNVHVKQNKDNKYDEQEIWNKRINYSTYSMFFCRKKRTNRRTERHAVVKEAALPCLLFLCTHVYHMPKDLIFFNV